MIENVVILLTFLTGFLGIFSVNLVIADLFEQDRKEAEKRQQELQRIEQRERARRAINGNSQLASLGQLADAAADESGDNKTTLQRFSEWIDQSGTRWSTGKLLRVAGTVGLVIGAPIGLLARSPAIGASVGLLFASIPIIYLSMKRKQRLGKLRSQMPDALELMSRILRSGQTMTQAMQSVALESSAPIATEFGYCYEQQNLGLSQEMALNDLTRRTGLLEIKIFVLAMLVHRKSGGNLADLLDKLAYVVRERFRLRGKIRALTAEGRLQAIMLLALPPGLYGMILLINRDYAMKLMDHPPLVIATIVSMAIGAFFIRRIVNFDF